VTAAWDRVHPRLTHRAAWLDHDGPLPVIEGTLIRLTVDHLPGDRDPRPVWRRLACARARQPAADVVASPMTTRVQFADMQDARARLRAACHLAAELLALSGIDEQTLLKPDGTPDPGR
jgi:hypothetical protein